jgi:hypothetical protein
LTHEIQPSDHDVPHSTTGDQTSRRRRGIVPWNCTKACISESSTVPLGLGWSRWREPSATPPDHSEASNAPSSDDNRLFQRGVHRGELGVELGAEPFTIAMIASEMPASIRPHSIGGRPRRARRPTRDWSDWRPSDCRDLDRRESRKLRHSAWNRWRRETSNLCSRSKPPNHQPGAKPPKVGGLGVTPIPRWGRLCFGDRKPGRPVRMPTIKPSSGRAIPRSQRLMRRRFYWAPSHLQFHRYVAGQATEVGAVRGAHDLEAIGEELNGWRVAVLLRQACLAGLAADRTPQVFVPLVFHGGRPSETAKTPAFGVRSNSNQAVFNPAGEAQGRRYSVSSTKYERGRQMRRPSVTLRAAQCPVRAASGEAARPVRLLAI